MQPENNVSTAATASATTRTPEEDKFYAFLDDPFTQQIVGKAYPKYRATWEKMFVRAKSIDKMGAQSSFNLWAFLLWPVWGLYRRILWLPLFFLVLAGGMHVYEVVNVTELPTAVGIAVGTTMAMLANGLYFTQVHKKVSKLRRYSPTEAASALRDTPKGGSYVLMILGTVVTIALMFGLMEGLDRVLIQAGYAEHVRIYYANL